MLSPSDRAPGLLLGDGVQVPRVVQVGGHVIIHSGVLLGHDVRVQDAVVIGKPLALGPQSTALTEPAPLTQVGDGTTLCAGAVIVAGASIGSGSVIGDQSQVRERAVIGDATVIGRGSAVDNDVVVGDRVRVQSNCYLTAYSVIEDDVFVAPGVLTSNDNFMGRTEARKAHFGGPTVRRGARLGVGAVLLPGREVAEEAVIAAGAVLTRDAEAGQVHVGVPARAVRPVPPEQRLDSAP